MNVRLIQKAVLEDVEAVRGFLLNDNQIRLLTRIKVLGGLTSSLLAQSERVSIQNASSKLKTLYHKGYLKRVNQGAESGGDEYFYSSKF